MNSNPSSSTLKVLGCVPSLLNILFELAHESRGIKEFIILKNMPVEIKEEYVHCADWNVTTINCYESECKSSEKDLYAFSVVGVKSKEKVFAAFRAESPLEKEQFINLIHPTSYVSRSVNLNHGLQLEPLSTIAACTTIGFGVNIKRNSTIGHHCRIDDFVTINPGVTLSSHVKVGKNTMLGSGTIVKDDITIGENSIIGAGSVVVKDIPPNVIAYGNPCKAQKQNG